MYYTRQRCGLMSSGFARKNPYGKYFDGEVSLKIPQLTNPPEASSPTLVPTQSGNPLIGLCWLCQLGKRHININMRRTAASHDFDRRLCLHVDMSCARLNREDKQSPPRKREKEILQLSICHLCILKAPPRNFIIRLAVMGLDPGPKVLTCDRKTLCYVGFFPPVILLWNATVILWTTIEGTDVS